MRRLLITVLLLASSCFLGATDYSVGPSQTYAEVGDVPWSSLVAGDTVHIYYRATPYRSMVAVTTVATSVNPLQIIGVSDGSGNQPIVSCQDAVASPNLGSLRSRSLVPYGALVIESTTYSGTRPSYIEVSNLTLRDCNGMSFYNDPLALGNISSGIDAVATSLPVAAVGGWIATPQTIRVDAEQMYVTAISGSALTVTRGYGGTTAATHSSGAPVFILNIRSAAGMYIYNGDNITLSYSTVTADGNGVFVNSPGGDANVYNESSNILIAHNQIYDNGTAGVDRQHNIYAEANKITYEYNYIGGLLPTSQGISLKDRSAGTVVRYNFIQCGGYCVEFVDAENDISHVSLPYYNETWLYGNILVDGILPNGNPASRAVVGFGDDNQPIYVKTGPLYAYNNTIIFNDVNSFGYAFKFINTAVQTFDVRNNLLYVRTPATYPSVSWFNSAANAITFGSNWQSPLTTVTYSSGSGTITGASSLYTDPNNAPAFANPSGNDYRITTGSTAVGLATSLATAVTSNMLGQDFTPVQQYVYPNGNVSRIAITAAGAYEAGAPPMTIAVNPSVLNFSCVAGSSGIPTQNLALSTTIGLVSYTATNGSSWLSLAGASGTGTSLSTISATVDCTSLTTPGRYNDTIVVTSPTTGVTDPTVNVMVTLTVSAFGVPVVTSYTLPSGQVSIPYSASLTAVGNLPMTWALTSGSMCSGLTLSTSGVISGTPTAAQMCSFIVTATNGAGSGSQPLTVIISPAPPPGSSFVGIQGWTGLTIQ